MTAPSFHASGLRLPVPRLISCVGVAAFGIAAWFLFSTMEEERILEALFQTDANVIDRAQSAEKWAQKGEEAIPRLREALRSPNTRVREYALLAFIYMPRQTARQALPDLLPLCEDETPSVQANALALVAELTDQPEKLAPLFASRLLSREGDIFDAAERGLERLGPVAVPHIAQVLPEAEPQSQERCLRLLAQFANDESRGEEARQAISHCLESPHAAVRQLAYELISSMRVLRDAEISAALRDAQAGILEIALSQYSNRVAANPGDLPALLGLLETRPRLRPLVLQGLMRFPPSSETFGAVEPWTNAEDPAVRAAAVEALVRVADDRERVVGILVRMVSDSHPRVAKAAARMLGEAAPQTAEAVVRDVLLPRLQSDEPGVQIAAAGALSGLPRFAMSERLTLIRVLAHESSASPVPPVVQFELAETLGQMGPAAQDAVPALLNLIERTSPRDPMLIVPVQALGNIGYADRSVLDVLIRLHGHPQSRQSRLRSAVIATLGKVGAGNKDVEQLLVADATSGGWPHVRLAGLKAIASLPIDRDTVHAAYVAALKSENINLRLGACRLLAERDDTGHAEDVAWQMISLLDDGSPFVRTLAAKTLARLGSQAAVALPALSRALVERCNQLPNRFEIDEEIDWNLIGDPARELQNQSVRAAVASAIASIERETTVQTSLVDKGSR